MFTTGMTLFVRMMQDMALVSRRVMRVRNIRDDDLRVINVDSSQAGGGVIADCGEEGWVLDYGG